MYVKHGGMAKELRQFFLVEGMLPCLEKAREYFFYYEP